MVSTMAKGVDLVAWRGCAKQQEMGQKRFAVTLKRVGRQASAGRSIPPPPSSASLTPEQRKRQQQHQEMRQAVAMFDAGTPECAACPLSGGKPYGCWVAVDYPIDAAAERALFDYFTAQLDDERSVSSGLYRDLVSKAPAQGSAWHKDRGALGTLAELDAPLVKERGFLLWKKRVDSAQLLASLFFNQRRMGIISAFAQFWEGFVEHARAHVPDFEQSPTLVQLEALSEFYARTAELAATSDSVNVIVENDAPGPGEEAKS
jgi:hypothetical protein